MRMPFHRDYPVRTYQSLMKDLEPAREAGPKRHRPRKREQKERVSTSAPDVNIWDATYRALMEYSLEQLEDMATREGVDLDELARRDSKGLLVYAIIEKRKERLHGKR